MSLIMTQFTFPKGSLGFFVGIPAALRLETPTVGIKKRAYSKWVWATTQVHPQRLSGDFRCNDAVIYQSDRTLCPENSHPPG